MLSKRVIPCLDVRAGRLTKGIKFQGNVDIGDPVESARRYYEEGADEIVFYDITASAEERGIFLDVVERVASQIFIPFSVGGGISSVADMRSMPGPKRSPSTPRPCAIPIWWPTARRLSARRPSWWAWTCCACP